jgi:hypothetical protein
MKLVALAAVDSDVCWRISGVCERGHCCQIYAGYVCYVIRIHEFGQIVRGVLARIFFVHFHKSHGVETDLVKRRVVAASAEAVSAED